MDVDPVDGDLSATSRIDFRWRVSKLFWRVESTVLMMTGPLVVPHDFNVELCPVGLAPTCPPSVQFAHLNWLVVGRFKPLCPRLINEVVG